MNFLYLDTSDKALTIAARFRGENFICYKEDCGIKHSETMLLALDSLLKEHKISLSDFDCFCAAVGPGSFTGIRIGVTTVRAFCQVYGKSALAVNSLQLKAYNIKTKNIAVPLIDAMQSKVYYAAYMDGEEIIKPQVCLSREADSVIKAQLQKLGYSGAVTYIYEKNIEGLETLSPNFPLYASEFCAKQIELGKTVHYIELEPLYAAVSQAEKTYADRN